MIKRNLLIVIGIMIMIMIIIPLSIFLGINVNKVALQERQIAYYLKSMSRKDDILMEYEGYLKGNLEFDDKLEAMWFPKETARLSIKPAGLYGKDKDLLIVHVHPGYKEWLLRELSSNGGVEYIYEVTRPIGIGGAVLDYKYDVMLTPRIGKDDWDALFALPDKLSATLIISEPTEEDG